MHKSDMITFQKTPIAQNQIGMYQVSDQEGKLQMDEILTGSLDRDKLTEDDVFVIDTGTEVFLYIGKGKKPGALHNRTALYL